VSHKSDTIAAAVPFGSEFDVFIFWHFQVVLKKLDCLLKRESSERFVRGFSFVDNNTPQLS
jgi:hypothetical protein